MAEPIPDNIDGQFYVSTRCINCSLCAEAAPDLFDTNHDEGYEYVKRQPVTESEFKLMAEMISLCPADAIEERS